MNYQGPTEQSILILSGEQIKILVKQSWRQTGSSRYRSSRLTDRADDETIGARAQRWQTLSDTELPVQSRIETQAVQTPQAPTSEQATLNTTTEGDSTRQFVNLDK